MITLTEAIHGYEAGTALRDVTLSEARAMECNQCGACCAGDSVDSKKRPDGLPMFTWGKNPPEMIRPVVRGENGLEIGKDFEMVDGESHTSFHCDHVENGACGIFDSEERPRPCWDFPVFGILRDSQIISGKPFIPNVGWFPKCTWYGLRVTGPYMDTDYWREHWEAQHDKSA